MHNRIASVNNVEKYMKHLIILQTNAINNMITTLRTTGR